MFVGIKLKNWRCNASAWRARSLQQIAGVLLAVHFLLVADASAMALTLTSNAFNPGDKIPSKYTCEGDDVSPPLAFGDVPQIGQAAFTAAGGQQPRAPAPAVRVTPKPQLDRLELDEQVCRLQLRFELHGGIRELWLVMHLTRLADVERRDGSDRPQCPQLRQGGRERCSRITDVSAESDERPHPADDNRSVIGE